MVENLVISTDRLGILRQHAQELRYTFPTGMQIETEVIGVRPIRGLERFVSELSSAGLYPRRIHGRIGSADARKIPVHNRLKDWLINHAMVDAGDLARMFPGQEILIHSTEAALQKNQKTITKDSVKDRIWWVENNEPGRMGLTRAHNMAFSLPPDKRAFMIDLFHIIDTFDGKHKPKFMFRWERMLEALASMTPQKNLLYGIHVDINELPFEQISKEMMGKLATALRPLGISQVVLEYGHRSIPGFLGLTPLLQIKRTTAQAIRKLTEAGIIKV